MAEDRRESLGEIQNTLSRAEHGIEEAAKKISSQRIPASLERFDRWFFRYQKSELARWIILEWGAPIALGLWAAALTFPVGRVATLFN